MNEYEVYTDKFKVEFCRFTIRMTEQATVKSEGLVNRSIINLLVHAL